MSHVMSGSKSVGDLLPPVCDLTSLVTTMTGSVSSLYDVVATDLFCKRTGDGKNLKILQGSWPHGQQI
jgi:hypothetical protein